MTNDEFRALFPEFTSVETYPDAQVVFWLNLAGNALPADRWGDYLTLGQALFAAHNLVLGARETQGMAAGRAAGTVSGPMTSKSVGGVSASYDVATASMAGGGDWNLTSYGQRFQRLSRMAGMGGIQL